MMGSPEHALEWNGATWHFANADNRATFEADPEAYAPAFGGYCAYAASRGYVATTVPEAWTVTEGRLFLNYSVACAAVGCVKSPMPSVQGTRIGPAS